MRTWWKRCTLRVRLATWYAVVGSLLLALFSALLYFFVAHSMARPLDYQLRGDLSVVRARLGVQSDGGLLWDGRKITDDLPWDARNPWFELWDDQGRLVRRLWPLADDSLQHLPAAPVRGRETISVFNVDDDVRLRVLSVPFPVPGQPAPWMLRVMRIHRPAAEALGALRLIIFVSLPAVVALLVAGGYILTRRWLKPLDDMVAEADRITAHDLGRRLPMANPHDELGRLAAVFNTTLARLEDSFAALDRFVTDASHELRTPLTTLRSVGEVGLRGERSAAEYREIMVLPVF
jgi:two-component system OmpR family sensor kinase